MSELELKFQVPAEARRGVLKAIGQATPLRLQAHYHDTADGLLGRHRLSLRLRKEGRRWVQTLKGQAAHALERAEDNVDRGTGAQPPALDIGLHAHCEVGRHLAHLLESHGQPALVTVYATDIRRHRRVLQLEDASIEAAFDEGRILAGEREQAVCELELELVSGPAASLFVLADEWAARHGLWLDPVSKAQRGELLARGRAHVAPVKAEVPAIDRKMAGPVLLQRVVAACLAQALPNAGALAAGSDDDEHLHQLRIAVRRLRTALRELGGLSAGVDGGWNEALSETFGALGALRDATALAQSIAPQLAAAGAPLSSWAQPATPTAASPSDIVRATAFQRTLLRLLAFAHGSAHEAGEGRPRVFIAKRLQRLHRRVTRDAEHFGELAFADQHRIRKQLKRLRYLAEFAAPLHGRKAVARYLKPLEAAQDALGAHVDAGMALQAFEQAAARDARAWFAVGWLRSRLNESGREGAKALKKVAKAERFWD